MNPEPSVWPMVTIVLIAAGCLILGTVLLAPAANRLTDRLAGWISNRRFGDFAEGCCECGTGGHYYTGDRPSVVRYLYSGACHGTPPGEIDWSACTRHAIRALEPVLDYGTDVAKTIREVRADYEQLTADRAAGLTRCTRPGCYANVTPHTHPEPHPIPTSDAARELDSIIGTLPIVEDGNDPLDIAELLRDQLATYLTEHGRPVQ